MNHSNLVQLAHDYSEGRIGDMEFLNQVQLSQEVRVQVERLLELPQAAHSKINIEDLMPSPKTKGYPKAKAAKPVKVARRKPPEQRTQEYFDRLASKISSQDNPITGNELRACTLSIKYLPGAEDGDDAFYRFGLTDKNTAKALARFIYNDAEKVSYAVGACYVSAPEDVLDDDRLVPPIAVIHQTIAGTIGK